MNTRRGYVFSLSRRREKKRVVKGGKRKWAKKKREEKVGVEKLVKNFPQASSRSRGRVKLGRVIRGARARSSALGSFRRCSQ